MATLCLQEEQTLVEKVQTFPNLYDKKDSKRELMFNMPGRKLHKMKILQKMIILLKQVATENILK